MAGTPEDDAILQGRDLQSIFQLWDRKHSTPGFDPEIILTRYRYHSEFLHLTHHLPSVNYVRFC